MRRRITACMLAAVMVMGALAGCNGKQGGQETGGQGPASSGSQENQEAMGRYVESEITLPEDITNQRFLDCTVGKDGKLEAFFYDSEAVSYTRYRLVGGVWEKDDSGWMEKVQNNIDASTESVLYGQDGHYYVGGHDSDYIYHLHRVEEDGALTELLADVFKAKEGKEYGLRPDMLGVLEDGSILVSSIKEAALYTPDGKQILSLPQDFLGIEKRRNSFLAGSQYVTVLNNEIVRYDLGQGKVVETVGTIEDINSGSLFTGPSGGVFRADRSGIYHINENGTVWEQLMDGSLSSLGMQSLYIQKVIEGDDRDFYGVLTNEDSAAKVFHYTYDENMVTVPPNTLSIYALKDNQTVHQAAALFQKKFPDGKVDFTAAMEDDGAAVSEDIIRSLNTELLNGKGADILILDGLPAGAYRDKGILLDMKELFAEIGEENPLLPNITAGFTDEEGGVYYMPARIRMPIAYGEERAVEALKSLDGIASYQGEKPLFSAVVYENLLRLVANLQYKEIFQDDGKNVDREGLDKYLEAVKAAGEQAGCKVEFSEEDMEIYKFVNYVNADGFLKSDAISYMKGECAVAIDNLDSGYSMMYPWEVMSSNGFLPSAVNQVYFPAVMAGINSATDSKDMAMEFMKVLYSKEVQEQEFYDGFPINQEALESWKTVYKNMSVAISSNSDEFTLSAEWPTVEEQTEVINLIPKLQNPVNVDQVVMGMIVDGSKEYFNGEATKEEAVAAIENKLRLYLSE